jgi:hypothetical protein
MKYDDFLGRAIPNMTERAKINLRTLDFQLYTYGTEYPCPPLYLKSRYLNEELPNRVLKNPPNDADAVVS